jgi:hypothetical protein
MITLSAAHRWRCGALAVSLLFCSPSGSSHAASGVGVTGQGSQVLQPDPKRPGKYLWKLWAREFVIESPSKGVSGTMKGISAVLFQNGAPSATMAAAQAKGNNVQNIIVASGGVVVKSLLEPGTILRADSVTWYQQKNQVVAVGHVYYKNGKSGMTIIPSGALTANTSLKTVRSDDGAHIKLP